MAGLTPKKPHLGVSIASILSASIATVERSAQVIRDVARGGKLDAVDKAQEGSSSGKAAAYEDPQTVADRRSQTVIIESLKQAFPSVTIIGEEEGVIKSADDPPDLVFNPPTSSDFVKPDAFPQWLRDVDASRICIWVDPLDATREFTRGIYSAVTTLVGISVDEEPVAGVVGVPIAAKLEEDVSKVYWGCIDVGVFERAALLQAPQQNGQFRVAITGSRRNAALDAALEAIGPDDVIAVGGTGNKIMHVLQGKAECYLNNTAGTKRWDTCAGEALLRAMGGQLTDVNGSRYRYVPAAHEHLVNQDGIIAALDPAAAARVKACASKCRTTADITRDADGRQIDAEWLRANLRVPHADRILSFDAPESSAVRSRHSHVVKLHLRYPAKDVAALGADALVHTVLLKRCVAKDLSDRTAEKLARDVKSYANEASFVRELSAKLHDEGKVHVASPFYTFTDTQEDPAACRYLTIVESLENFEQFSFLSFGHACAALHQLARFHAFFLSTTDAMEAAKKHLWAHGGHWDTDKIPQGSKEIAKTDETFRKWFSRFASCGGVFDDPDMMTLGTRYQKHAESISKELHEAVSAFPCVIHGDYKTANIFFGKRADYTALETLATETVASASGEATRLSFDMALIDWQWTGLGIPAQDVIYLFVTSLDLNALEREDELLAFYHQQLVANLREMKSSVEYTFDTFKTHYRLASLDYIRKLIAYNLASASPAEVEKIKDEMNRGMYIRRLEVLQWLLKRAVKLIDERA